MRLIPEWNPLGKIGWLKFFEIDWWQFVPFVELGRVADTYDLGELHRDMKWDAGLSLRAMMKKFVVRLDLAAAEDEFAAVVMVNHPFPAP